MNTSPPRTITDEEIRTYEEDGVVCLRGMFDSDWAERLREAVDSVPGGYDDRAFAWPINETIREFVFLSPLGEIAATLMRSRTCGLYVENLFVKGPHAPHVTPWHHDLPYYQMQGSQVCGVWLGLDEATLENGGMEWIRGSHKWGRMFDPDPFDGGAYAEVGTGRERVPDIDNHREDYDIVHFDTEPGDCIVEHLLMLHAGGPNRTGGWRRAIASALYGDDARFASIPLARGVEDSRDLGLKDGDPFPPEHELVPRIWPKRDRADWPKPRHWRNLPGAISPFDERIAGLAREGADTQR